jgi:hypothetical protein
VAGLPTNAGAEVFCRAIAGAYIAVSLSRCHYKPFQSVDQIADKIVIRSWVFLIEEPKAQRLVLPGATIHNATELDQWLAGARKQVEEKLKDGPVILYPDSSKTREKFLVFFGLADSAWCMIRGGFLTRE